MTRPRQGMAGNGALELESGPPMTGPERIRLTSWKEIAAHLRREVRTVIRWEKERGLPVHRLPGGQGRSVFAFTDELDKWAAGEIATDQSPVPDRLRPASRARGALAIAAAVSLVIAAVASGLAMTGWPHREIARVVVGDTSIHAIDDGGRPLWSYPVGGHAQATYRRLTQVFDLTGDRHPDAVATAIVTGREDIAGDGQLYALDERGQLLWHRSLDDHLAFGAGPFEAPWVPDDVAAFTTAGGEPFVAWSVHHLTWWPSMLTVFDARGSRVGTFVNAGWIRRVQPSADGRHLITGGFSNSRQGAAFAILDARRVNGSSPEDPGSPFECRNCPAGRPLRYFVLEWSDVSNPLPPDERDVEVTVHPTGSITLHATQRRHVELLVDLSSSFELRRRAVDDRFWDWHRRLEHTGGLTHTREACPYRDGPIVREWTPDAGWKTHGG